MHNEFTLNDFDVAVTTRPDSELIEEFYREYARAFVLPDERETLEGFRVCLGLNGPNGMALRQRFGASREYIAILRGPGGEFAAGLNFICFPMPDLEVTTIHSIYVFVAEAWRGRGLLRLIYRAMEGIAREYVVEFGMPPDTEMMFFGEQNDPFRMTPEMFVRDSEASGLNQFDRLTIWGRIGSRVLAFRYVQPALSDASSPDDTLFLRILFRGDQPMADRLGICFLSPLILRDHLRRFFGITVLKGRCDSDSLPEVKMQEDDLEILSSKGASVPAYPMPNERLVSEWKAQTARLLENLHKDNAEKAIGMLLGIISVPEALVLRIGV